MTKRHDIDDFDDEDKVGRFYAVLIAVLVVVAALLVFFGYTPAHACDQDGDRGICAPDNWQPTGETYYDGDMDDGRSPVDNTDPSPEELDNGRGPRGDTDR